MRKLFLMFSSVLLAASMLAYFVDMPVMSWGGLGFIGGVLFILGLGSDQP